MIDYTDLKDESPTRENERKKGLEFADFVCRWLKYLVGILFLFFSNKLLALAGLLILIFSIFSDNKST